MPGKVNCRSRQERAARDVQIPQGSPPRQKKPAPFRFRGLRKSRENAISAVSFFLSKPDPLCRAPVWGGPSLPGGIGIHVRLKLGRREDWGFESLGRHHARVTELVYVPGSKPGALGHVSSNLTARTIPGSGLGELRNISKSANQIIYVLSSVGKHRFALPGAEKAKL